MLKKLTDCGVIAVIRAKNHKEAKEYISACSKGGIKAIELTYTIPQLCELIKEVKEDKDLLVGAGSVLNGQMAIDAIEAGASYIVSPGYSEEVNDVCKDKGVLYLPGCMTVSEMMNALNKGNQMVKLFPGDQFGPKFIKAVKAPIPQIKIMPTGGVDIDNIDQWFANGVSCVGVGSSLLSAGSLEEIEKLAIKFVEKINEIRN